MMSKRQNRAWMEARANYTMLAFVMDVDFEVESISQTYDGKWVRMMESGEVTREQVREQASQLWNVVRELQVRLKAVKPVQGDDPAA